MENTQVQKVEETLIPPPNENKDADEGQDHTEREVFTQQRLSKEWQLSRYAPGGGGGGGLLPPSS